MANENLMKELELCMEQQRFYETQQDGVMKYLFTLTTAVATIELAVLAYLKSQPPFYFIGLSVLSYLVFIATVVLLTSLVKAMASGTLAARRMKAIHLQLMAAEGKGQPEGVSSTRMESPGLRFLSLPTVYLLGAALMSSVFTGAFVYGVVSYLSMVHMGIFAVLVAVVVCILEMVWGFGYLKNATEKFTGDTSTAKAGKSK